MRWSIVFMFIVYIVVLHDPTHIESFAADGAVEISVTVSGTILLGLGYRWFLDDDSSVRFGSYIGVQGKPLGFNIGLIQDLSKSSKWSPFMGVGGDLMMARDNHRLKTVTFVRGVGGVAYKPHHASSWNTELWLAFFPNRQRLAPIGISLNYLDRLW